MDVVNAFKSTENYLAFFTEVEKACQEHQNCYQEIVTGIEKKFQELISDTKPTKVDEFLVPELPKIKKEPKEKRVSRATKKTLPGNSRMLNVTRTSEASAISQNDSILRRSSRCAAKTKTYQGASQISSFASPEKVQEESGQNQMSPSLPPAKIRRTGDLESVKSSIAKPLLDETVCTTDMKQPLGSSTPTDSVPEASPGKENYSALLAPLNPSADAVPKVADKTLTKVKEVKTPVSELKNPIKGESVKKRVEEFEKRTQAAAFSTSKLPIRTPDKKPMHSASKNHSKITDGSVKGLVFTEKEASMSQGRCTRNTSKVLQEKNTNINMIKEKGQEAQKKKAVIIKASVEETKRRREERARKVAAQREAAEKEKLELVLKQEKEKEMKLKMIQKQKDEKLKTETLRKKQLSAMKAAENEERRKKEEAARLLKLKEAESKSEFCDYGIEHVLDGASSDDEEKPKNQIPQWATKENRKHQLCVQAWLDKKETVYKWFYNSKLKYPKLEELFSAGVKMRPRTSSAFWNSRVCFDDSSFV